MSEQLTDEQIVSVSNKMMRYINKCNIEGVKYELDPFNKAQRKCIASRQIRGNTALFIAVKYNHLQLVQYLLEDCNVPVDQSAMYSSYIPVTPLWMAVICCYQDVVRLLLEHGADVNTKGITGTSALKMAAENGDVDIANCLIRKGADVNMADQLGVTPLMTSVFNMDMMNLLLRNGANLFASDSVGNLALHFAACKGNLEVFKFLLVQGLSPYLCNAAGNDAFRLATTHRQCKILIYLLLSLPYPKESPLEYFDLFAVQRFKEALAAEEEENGNDNDDNNSKSDIFEFPVLMVTEKILGPFCPQTLYALRDAAQLQCDCGNITLAWDIYCRLLDTCRRTRRTINCDIITNELTVFWKIYCEDRNLLMPFNQVVSLVRQILSDVILDWESVQKENCEQQMMAVDTTATKLCELQKVFLFSANLIKFLIRHQHKWNSTTAATTNNNNSSQKLCCSMLDMDTRLVTLKNQHESVFERKDASEVGTGLGVSRAVVSLRFHGKCELLDVLLQVRHESQCLVLGGFLKEPQYTLCDSAKLIPVKKPLSLQCLTARVLNRERIQFQKQLPVRLVDFVLHHMS